MAHVLEYALKFRSNEISISRLQLKSMKSINTYELIGGMADSAWLEDKNSLSKRLSEATERLAHEMAYYQRP